MKTLDWNDIDVSWIVCEDVVLDKVGILDILDKCDLDYATVSGGEFSYRMRCPFTWHADGAERTASLYISRDQDSFYCFGCNYNGNTINFTEYLLGKPYDKAIEWLAGIGGITEDNVGDIPSISRIRRKPEETVAFYVMKAGVLIRRWLKLAKGQSSYERYCDWAERQFITLDNLLDLDDAEWERAKEKYDIIQDRLAKYVTEE